MPDGCDAMDVLVDVVRLRQRFDDDDELLAEIFRVFQSEVPERQSGFAQALADGDMMALTQRAHSLKGVAATMFAEPLRQAAYELEVASRGGDAVAVARLAPVMLDRLEATSRHVATLV